MLEEYPLDCICGAGRPKLETVEITCKGGVPFVLYCCASCGAQTFSTRKEEYCRELWNSTIKRKTGLI